MQYTVLPLLSSPRKTRVPVLETRVPPPAGATVLRYDGSLQPPSKPATRHTQRRMEELNVHMRSITAYYNARKKTAPLSMRQIKENRQRAQAAAGASIVGGRLLPHERLQRRSQGRSFAKQSSLLCGVLGSHQDFADKRMHEWRAAEVVEREERRKLVAAEVAAIKDAAMKNASAAKKQATNNGDDAAVAGGDDDAAAGDGAAPVDGAGGDNADADKDGGGDADKGGDGEADGVAADDDKGGGGGDDDGDAGAAKGMTEERRRRREVKKRLYLMQEVHGTTRKYSMHMKSREEVELEEEMRLHHVALAFKKAWNRGYVQRHAT
jgi:hypothetical protein